MASIEVLLFAVLRDRFGAARVSVEVEGPVTASDLLGRMKQLYPEQAGQLASCRLAVNREFAAADRPVTPADEVALIPPVSGG